MKALFSKLFFLSWLMLSSVAAVESQKDAEKAIIDLANDFVKDWNNHEPQKLAALWTDDGNLITPWSKELKGKKEIENYFTFEHSDRMKSAQLKFEVEKVRLVDPETAFVDANLTITGMSIAGVSAAPFRDHAVFLMVKQNGVWKILIARPY